MGESEINDLLDEFIDAHEDYLAYLRRDDCVRWSQRAETDATERYFDLRNKIITLMSGDSGQE